MDVFTQVESIIVRICDWCDKEYDQNESDSIAPDLYCSACCENGGTVHHTETPEVIHDERTTKN